MILTHASDTDGIACGILFKLVYEDAFVVLTQNKEIDLLIKDMIKEKKIFEYDLVYITDLGLEEETIKLIEENEKLASKFKLLDHHKSNMSLNKYNWCKVILKENDKLTCAASILYEDLIYKHNGNFLKNDNIKHFVKLTRLIDTWEWKLENNLEAKMFGYLFIFYGNEVFFDIYLDRLKDENSKILKEEEIFFMNIEDKRIKNYIDKKEKTMKITSFEGFNVGVVFADSYKSHLGNVLAERNINKIDFVMIIDLSKAISLRSVKDDIDVSLVASKHNGGGHKKAASFPIKEYIIEDILKFF